MVEKRPLEELVAADGQQQVTNGVSDGAAAAKRAKLDGAPGKPALSLEALEKAKKALQLQKELKEKLKNLPQLQKAPAAGVTLAAASGAATTSAAAATQQLASAAVAKAAELAARFGVSVTPAPAPLAPAPAVAAGVAVGTGPKGFKAAPLRLDAQGREVDEFGNLVASRTQQPVATLRVNQVLPPAHAPSSSMLAASAAQPAAPASEQQQQQGADASHFFDPRMGARGLRKLNRKARATFEFVEEGEMQRQAEAFRLQARYGREARGLPLLPGSALPPLDKLPIGPAGPGGADQVPGEGQAQGPGTKDATPAPEELEEPDEDVPAVEWWDKGLLAFGSYAQDVPEDPDHPVQLNDRKITLYVEHPVPIQPPAEGPPPPPQPLKLTAREVKKLRTQRRLAREKEKQDLIRQGLLEPPKPKVKISNLYRVLGEQAVLDPTAIELETKRQMAARQQAHEDRNLARALTPAERKDKKLRKMFDGTGLDVITSVYRVVNLDNPQNRYKVEVNAKENHMTGVLLVTPAFSLVVVEGCNKSTKRYTKLMLRRIDWTAPPPAGQPGKGLDEGVHAAGDAEDEDDEDRPPNRCDLVWQGLVKEAAFKGFKAEVCATLEHAQQVLAQRNVLHYWDAARNFVPGESAGINLVMT